MRITTACIAMAVLLLAAPGEAAAALDVSVSVSASPLPIMAGRDLNITIKLTNNGDEPHNTYASVTVTYPSSWQPIRAGDYYSYQPGELKYGMGGSVGFTDVRSIYIRPTAGNSTITVSAPLVGDFTPENNTASIDVDVTPSPPPNPVPRYRLYNDVSKEHLYTTDLNEYQTLGASGSWVQEGTVGQLLENPGTFNGVTAIPYYRIYSVGSRRHLWTHDPNEYYGLAPAAYNGAYVPEGVDGYLFPTQAPGTTKLYRLRYPPWNPSYPLHHWTTDKAEHDALVSTYGWVSETSPGYVIP